MNHVIILLLLPSFSLAQPIPRNANTIVVRGISFAEACGRLLELGYSIESKDNDLMTARTERRLFPDKYNAEYAINIRVADTALYISGTLNAPPGGALFKNEPIVAVLNRKGELSYRDLWGYAFSLMQNYALTFDKKIDYMRK